MQQVGTYQKCNASRTRSFEPCRFFIFAFIVILIAEICFYPDDGAHIGQYKIGPEDKIMAFSFIEIGETHFNQTFSVFRHRKKKAF